MILVNNPGSTAAYWPLQHARWNGWTPTDLIFPFFLFIVGVSLVFSFESRMRRRRLAASARSSHPATQRNHLCHRATAQRAAKL